MISKFLGDIESAFSKVEYPGDYNIASSDGMEGSEVQAAFQGKSWKDISCEHISELSFALIYFKPKAFIYFLPAFLIGCIRDDESAHGSCCDSVVRCFTPSQGDHTGFHARMRLFSKDQFKVIQRYLHYLIAIDDQDTSEIHAALDYIASQLNTA